MTSDPIAPEFSRPLRVEHLPPRLSRHDVEATPEECAALADRFGLPAIAALSARLEIEPRARGLVRLRGRLVARVTQACVVTLAPLEAEIDTGFALVFAPADEEDAAAAVDLEVSWDGGDPPDPIIDGRIDLGEVVAEQLALALDPFPRAPGAAFEPPPEPEEAPAPAPSPFAALAALRQKLK